MADPFIVGPHKPLEPGPVESFKSMNSEIDSGGGDDQTIGEPVLPCKQPFIEVWLFDNQPQAMPEAECRISLPTGKSNSGKLDSSGYLKIENFDVDAPDLKNSMALAIANPDGTIEIQFVRDAEVKEEEDDDPEPEIAELPPLYFTPPFNLPIDEIDEEDLL